MTFHLPKTIKVRLGSQNKFIHTHTHIYIENVIVFISVLLVFNINFLFYFNFLYYFKYASRELNILVCYQVYFAILIYIMLQCKQTKTKPLRTARIILISYLFYSFGI